MKYLFLLAGIAAFGFASAQKDELYYFKKQLEKKQQNSIVLLPKYQPPVLLLPQNNYLPQKDIAYILPDGNKVSALPQDNMPCVMPDMNQFNMPNVGSPEMLHPGRNVIPNPGLIQKC